jgi:V/A-type H+-transporting ATPase subunit A
LQNTADLVGLTALPTEERITLLVARLISETILQQSALSDNDSFCELSKQRALVGAVLDVHDAMQTLGRAGVPASVLEDFDFGPLIRAKDETAPGDADGVDDTAERLLQELEGLAP